MVFSGRLIPVITFVAAGSAISTAVHSENKTTITSIAPAEVLRDTGGSFAVQFLHHINSLEIQQAQRTLPNLQNSGARNFAQMLLQEHQAHEQSVSRLAAKKNIALFAFQPATFELAQESELNSFSGAEYDRAFLEAQRQAHEAALLNLNNILRTTRDAGIRTIIEMSLRMMRMHRDQAASLALQHSTAAVPRAKTSARKPQ